LIYLFTHKTKETEGVPVVTFGETLDFPGFYTPKSGSKSPYCSNSAEEIATIFGVFFKKILTYYFY